VIVDLGTGDGRAVLARAAAEPRALVIGIDANASAMVDASRRAAGRPERGGLDNACFLVEGAEALPGLLGGAASLVAITLPWGSLLRGVVGLDAAALCGIASIVAPGGRIEALVSVLPTDRVEGIGSLDRSARRSIAAAWAAVGLELGSMRPATRDEVLASRSSWARRLGGRPVWRLEIRRRGPAI
jgi:16S rRNA (adenine(1408)-N(1))-methyltransferase